MNPSPFLMYGSTHLLTIACVCGAMPLLYAHFKQTQIPVFYDTLFILLLVTFEVICFPFTVYYLHYPWQISLPLNFCDFSRLFLILYFLTKSDLYAGLGLFWGVGGCLIAFLSPDIQQDFPSIEFFAFCMSHATILFAITYILGQYGYHPSHHCLKRAVVIGILFTGIVYIVNILLGRPANYWYLMTLPSNAIAFKAFLPSPPWHMILFYPIAFVVFPMIYWPFYVLKRA